MLGIIDIEDKMEKIILDVFGMCKDKVGELVKKIKRLNIEGFKRVWNTENDLKDKNGKYIMNLDLHFEMIENQNEC